MKYRARSFAALSLALMLSACGSSQPETLSILAMDTAMTFSVYGDDADTVLSDASLEVRAAGRFAFPDQSGKCGHASQRRESNPSR